MKRVSFSRSDFSGGSFGGCQVEGVFFDQCNLCECDFFHTPLDGMDFTTSQISGILLSGSELKGAVVTPLQAAELASLLGLIVRLPEEDDG